MTNIQLIIVIAFVILGGVAAILWRRASDTAAVIMVVGILVTAVIVTSIQVDQYRQHQAAQAQYSENDQASQAAANLPPPPTAPIITPAVGPSSPTLRGPTGGAAPAAARNPYARS